MLFDARKRPKNAEELLSGSQNSDLMYSIIAYDTVTFSGFLRVQLLEAEASQSVS
jgi:hypothetical protein